ncbi:MAG: tetratricopeptide repeat protein [Candidatus Omnitrophica bacterium]|nr:tetratricopeptide repeat protein [Candidatus Omnitrophota bacterium]
MDRRLLKTSRFTIRRGLAIAPVVTSSIARRIVEQLTQAYQKFFIAAEDVDGEYYKHQGYAYFRKADYAKARDFLIAGAGESCRDPEILSTLGRCCQNLGDRPAAVAYLKKAEKIAENDPDILRALAECLYADQEYAAARVYFEKARRFAASDAELWFRLGVCCANTGSADQAEHCYKMAIAQDPARFEYHQSLGNLYQAARRKKEALASFRSALHAQWRQERTGQGDRL